MKRRGLKRGRAAILYAPALIPALPQLVGGGVGEGACSFILNTSFRPSEARGEISTLL